MLLINARHTHDPAPELPAQEGLTEEGRAPRRRGRRKTTDLPIYRLSKRAMQRHPRNISEPQTQRL